MIRVAKSSFSTVESNWKTKKKKKEGIRDVREREKEYWKERYKIGGRGKEEKGKKRVLYAGNRGVEGEAVKWPSQRDRNRAARKSGCK